MAISASEIEARLRAKLSPTHVEVRDESARHAGHPGAASGGGHFEVLIVSSSFAGRTALERHRIVYAALGDLHEAGIHALALRTLSPDEHRAPPES